jgi:RHS repeat-associated protein
LGYQAQYPYGVEYTPQTVNDREKYATYTRDSVTGLDYAVNRYYSSQWGRFLSPDPYVNSAGLAEPGSWNRYAYAGNDPINAEDPGGLLTCLTFADSMPVLGPDWEEGAFEWGWVYQGVSFCPGFLYGFNPLGGGSSGGTTAPVRPVGYNGALQDLARTPCYQYFGFSSAAAAQAAFASLTFVIANLGVPQVQEVAGGLQIVAGTPPPSSTEGNTVTVNYSYNWLDFSSVSAQDVTTGQPITISYLGMESQELGFSMNTSQLAGLLLLHEFRHSTAGGNAPQEPPGGNKAFNLPIYQNCIGAYGPAAPPAAPPSGGGQAAP